jgi:hypothetical protein
MLSLPVMKAILEFQKKYKIYISDLLMYEYICMNTCTIQGTPTDMRDQEC